MQKTWIRVTTTLITLGIMMMIFLFSTEPAADSDLTSGIIAERAADFIWPAWRQLDEEARLVFFSHIQLLIRKSAHFTEFACLGISLRLCLESWFGMKKWLNWVSWSGGSVYAVLDELHQLAVDGRSGQWMDVLIDSAGAILGVMFISWLILQARKR